MERGIWIFLGRIKMNKHYLITLKEIDDGYTQEDVDLILNKEE